MAPWYPCASSADDENSLFGSSSMRFDLNGSVCVCDAVQEHRNDGVIIIDTRTRRLMGREICVKMDFVSYNFHFSFFQFAWKQYHVCWFATESQAIVHNKPLTTCHLLPVSIYRNDAVWNWCVRGKKWRFGEARAPRCDYEYSSVAKVVNEWCVNRAPLNLVKEKWNQTNESIEREKYTDKNMK